MEAIMLKNFKLSNLFVLVITLLVSFSFSNKIFAEAIWVPFPGGSDSPTPAKVTVLESDDNHTIIDYSIPGMWVDKVEVQGKVFQKISLPDWYGSTLEIGKPEVPVLRDFVAIPWGNQASIKVIENKNIKLKGYNVYPFQTPKTDDDTKTGPFDYDEYFYSQDQFYPFELSLVSKPVIMRDLNLVNVSANILRYNPAEKTLEVNYNLQIELSNDYIGSEDQQPSGIVDSDYANIYRNLVINYDFLNLPEGSSYIYDYFIVTPDQFYNTNVLNNLVSHLTSEGHSVYVAPLSQTGSTAEQIKSAIKKAYQGWNIKYVLLIGDVGLIPIPYDHTIPSDYSYSLLTGDDLVAEVTVGRLSVDYLSDLDHQVSKIVNYHSLIGPGGWTNRILFVTHKQQTPVNYELCKNEIQNLLYPPPPNITYIKGSNPNSSNNDVKNAIEQGQIIINYRGHGWWDSWSDWCTIYPYSWRNTEVDNLNNQNSLCTVFNITCFTGVIDIAENECLCEHWMNANYGAVATVGSTRGSWSGPNDVLDIWIFRYIYGKGTLPVDEVGLALFGARHEMLKEYWDEPEWPYACQNAMMYLLLGDPAMEIRLGTREVEGGVQSQNKASKENISSEIVNPYSYSLYPIFPNPVSNNATVRFSLAEQTQVKIGIYDIAGRCVKILLQEDLCLGEHSFSLNASSFANGLYILKMETPAFTATKNIVVAK